MSIPAEGPPLAAVYADVQQFYARHMHLLDAGAADEWAATFTEDGVFAPPSAPEPVRGRANLAAGVRESFAKLTAAGEVHRHLLSMVTVEPQPDGSLHVRSYAQVIATPRDGAARLHLMCVCADVLVRVDGELRVRERRVTRDDRPDLQPASGTDGRADAR
ncbi:SnoaL-like domain-containing protein [Thermomonospora echinospora]|uniref:SnoaL-like domain-containing protein n=1 Tax=Thermomonospora echinospora TaxID=1992 RepID=A0A1H5TSZ2_9ACTN|nr:nuclear transport factor 2 family protein [Thermomonospora echinospora]SEF65945.1 SnoaL-like domain-containing protein [Thermomonospora echinospora]